MRWKLTKCRKIKCVLVLVMIVYVLWICVKHSHSSLIFGSFSLRWVKIDKVNAILILSVWVSAIQPDKFLQCLLYSPQNDFSFWWFSEWFFLCLLFYAFAQSQIWRWLLQLFFVLSRLKNVIIIIKSKFSEFVWISRRG